MSRLLPDVGQCTPEMAHAMSRLDGYDHDRDMPGLQRWMDYWDAAVLAAPTSAPSVIPERGDAQWWKENYEDAEAERDEWKNAARQAGVCMSCALHVPEWFGCTDCLNTGWDGGAPAGFVPEAALAASPEPPDLLPGLKRARYLAGHEAILAEIARLEKDRQS